MLLSYNFGEYVEMLPVFDDNLPFPFILMPLLVSHPSSPYQRKLLPLLLSPPIVPARRGHLDG